MSQRTSMTLLLILTATVALIFLLLPRIPQPEAYHLFADRRSLLASRTLAMLLPTCLSP